jgi:hypothetical protein
VRLLTLVLATFLAGAAAAAAGSRHQTAAPSLGQRALGKTALATSQVVCVSARSCVAVGGSTLLVERGGRWTAVHEPAPVILLSVACPAATRCVAVGAYGESGAVVLSEDESRWRLTVPALPGAPAPRSFPALTSVACASAGNCTAVGAYRVPQDTPLVMQEQGGTWGVATEPQLPANAARTRDPDYPDAGGALSLVACPSASRCTAAGTYTNQDALYSQYGWILDGSPAMAELPGDANVYGQPERSGTSPFFGFTGLACPGAGECTAVGGYWGRPDLQQGLILREYHGVWLQGTRAPVPANAGPNRTGPNEFVNPLTGLACGGMADCAAIGWYVDRWQHRRGLLLTGHGTSWRASELLLPGSAPRTAVPRLASVACPSPGTCVAVGSYAFRGRTYGLIVAERRGRWGRAVRTALPRDAAPAGRSRAFLNSVSCASATSCTAVGDYASRSGRTRALLLALRLR